MGILPKYLQKNVIKVKVLIVHLYINFAKVLIFCREIEKYYLYCALHIAGNITFNKFILALNE